MMHAKTIVTLLLVTAGAAIGIGAQAHETGPLQDVGATAVAIADAGIGEELVLVVAPPDRIASLDAAFGEVQGFFDASATDYRVTGIHVQTSPDASLFDCPTPGAYLERMIEGVLQQLECPLQQSVLRVLSPVDLTFVPKDRMGTDAFPSPCGGTSRPPCQRDRYREILDEDGTFRSGKLLLTAFRTQAGAESFIELSRTLGIDGLVTVSARKLGGGFVGLGQEAHPDGSGPLLHPLPDPTSYQR